MLTREEGQKRQQLCWSAVDETDFYCVSLNKQQWKKVVVLKASINSSRISLFRSVLTERLAAQLTKLSDQQRLIFLNLNLKKKLYSILIYDLPHITSETDVMSSD